MNPHQVRASRKRTKQRQGPTKVTKQKKMKKTGSEEYRFTWGWFLRQALRSSARRPRAIPPDMVVVVVVVTLRSLKLRPHSSSSSSAYACASVCNYVLDICAFFPLRLRLHLSCRSIHCFWSTRPTIPVATTAAQCRVPPSCAHTTRKSKKIRKKKQKKQKVFSSTSLDDSQSHVHSLM